MNVIIPKEKPVSADLYDDEYYKKYNHGYEDFIKDKSLMPELEEKVKEIDFNNKRVLDIACGRGEFVRYAALKGAYSYGVDYSSASIKISQKTVSDLDDDTRKKVDLRVMDAKSLEYEDDCFDIIVMFDIVEHLHDWELKKSLAEVHRILKPSGVVYIHTSPNKVMMSVVRFFVGLIGVKLKSSEFHVNEQTYYSIKGYTKKFKGNILLEKDVNYWSKQMVFRSGIVQYIAKTLDVVIDFTLVHWLLNIFPLSILTSTDIWFIGTKDLES